MTRSAFARSTGPIMKRACSSCCGGTMVRVRRACTPARAVRTPRDALAAYFDGELEAIADLATETNGTPFQRAVWAALRRIRPAAP